MTLIISAILSSKKSWQKVLQFCGESGRVPILKKECELFDEQLVRIYQEHKL
jgi:hypothetical protein